VFENRVPRRVFGPKRDEVTGEWRKLHNEELIDLYSSPNIFRFIIARRIIWSGHIASMGRVQLYTVFLVGKAGERDQLEDPDIDRMIILQWIFKKLDVGVWTGFIRLSIGTGCGLL
jgi:hypothetical protein